MNYETCFCNLLFSADKIAKTSTSWMRKPAIGLGSTAAAVSVAAIASVINIVVFSIKI